MPLTTDDMSSHIFLTLELVDSKSEDIIVAELFSISLHKSGVRLT